jgi:L-threonylcarbamoyladenylate synthase
MPAHSVAQAARVLRRGGLVAYPTEHCYGLGCDPMNRSAVLRLLQLKRRPWRKGLIVLAAEVAQLAPYVEAIPPAVLASWPGPYTWLLPARAGVPAWLTGEHLKIAVRVTAHPIAAALARAARLAIVSTSANRAGEAPARSEREVRRRLGNAVDFVLPGPVGDARAPTPIRDAASGIVVRP